MTKNGGREEIDHKGKKWRGNENVRDGKETERETGKANKGMGKRR